MDVITLDELIAQGKNKTNEQIIQGLINSNSSIVVAAPEKVGKSVLMLNACKAISENDTFLDIKPNSYHVDEIIYLSNDSSDTSIRMKLEKMDFTSSTIPIHFVFNKTLTVEELREIVSKISTQKRILLFVDVLSGLRQNSGAGGKKALELNDYVSVSDMIDEIEKVFMHHKSFGIIFVHHLKKGAKELLGSRAIASRVSATLIMTVDSVDSSLGMISIKSNDFQSRDIPIKRDPKKYKWVVDKDRTQLSIENTVGYQVLKLNEAINATREKRLVGNVNHIVAVSKVNIAPSGLTRWVKKYKSYLRENNIGFDIRKSNTTIIELYFIK